LDRIELVFFLSSLFSSCIIRLVASASSKYLFTHSFCFFIIRINLSLQALQRPPFGEGYKGSVNYIRDEDPVEYSTGDPLIRTLEMLSVDGLNWIPG